MHGSPPEDGDDDPGAVYEEEEDADTPVGRRMRSAMMRGGGPLSRMAEFLYLHMSAELNR